ncbi:hypothetical protein [Paraburkholderia bannensis]|uniref:hypothetical protein n=1 Tax=Paraburkholderia bannensis TaxID=765414 RepID=UPI002ABDB18C|nr:hypothetical protein [Paraburkholderia bannensis]
MKKFAIALAASLLTTAAFAQASSPAAPASASHAVHKTAKHKKSASKAAPCTLDQSKLGKCTLQ